jgi:hypothetical protein
VLSGAGFKPAGRREFAVEHRRSLPELAGHIRSTSFLPAAVLGGQSAAFDAGLAAALAPFGDRGTFTETVVGGGAPPPAGARYPREVPVSRYPPRSGITPGRFRFQR